MMSDDNRDDDNYVVIVVIVDISNVVFAYENLSTGRFRV
jgi:hypothetical protein